MTLGVRNGFLRDLATYALVTTGPEYDVKAYGAVGDGVTDDYDAVQAAITAAAGNPTVNNVVKFPAGTYYLGKAGAGGLRLPPAMAGLVLEGAGKGTTVIKLSKECLRAFDFWDTTNADLFQNITLRRFTVDAGNILPTDVGPSVTLTAYSLPGSSAYTAVDVGDNTLWASKGLVFFPKANTGTTKGGRFAFRKTSGSATSIDIRNDSGGTLTIVNGDAVSGAIADHVIVGTTFRGGADAAWNQRFDNITIEDVEALNIPTIPVTTGLGDYGPNFRAAVSIQPTSDPNNAPASPMYATRIYIRRCEAWGGEFGFAVASFGSSPQAYSMFIDDVVFEDLKHSAVTAPGANYTGANFFIGGSGYGYRATIRRCWGDYSGDVGVETDALLDVTVEDCVIEDAAGGNYYSTNYNTPCRTIAGPASALISNGGSGITNVATTLVINALPAGVANEGWLVIESELMRYSVVGSTTSITVARAQGGSTGVSHADGVSVVFQEAYRQKVRYRRCKSRHTRQGVLSNGWMPKGYYQLPNGRTKPGISIKDCEWENTTASIGLSASFGGEAIYVYGEYPWFEIDGFHASKRGFSYTTLDSRKMALIVVGRTNSTSTDIARLRWKNIEIRVSGDLASAAGFPLCSPILFKTGNFLLDWDSIVFDLYIRNGGTGATQAIDTGTDGSLILNGEIRRSKIRSRAGDGAPVFLRVLSTGSVAVTWLDLIDTDLNDFGYSSGAGDNNYRPFYIDSTNVAGVRIRGTRHASAVAGAFARDQIRYVQTATSYTALVTDDYIGVTSTASARTITLPPVTNGSANNNPKAMIGKRFIVKDESGAAGTNNITLTPNGTETIDGAASKAIATNGGVMTVLAVPAGWVVV